MKRQGYKDKTGDFNNSLNMVESSAEVITAWDFDYMIGFINSNGGEKAEYVLVDPEYSEMRNKIKSLSNGSIVLIPKCSSHGSRHVL